MYRSFEGDNPELHALFQRLSGEQVLYFACPGNSGDSLIGAATYQLFAKYGIPFSLLEPEEHPTNRTVLLAGGGNLVEMYTSMASVVRRLVNRSNRIIILPHSIMGHWTDLSQLGPNDLIFCREQDSYQRVKAAGLSAGVRLGHDLALYLDTALLEESLPRRSELMESFSNRIRDAKINVDKFDGKRVSCMRRGVEATFIPKGANYDISVVFKGGTRPGLSERASWNMVHFCSRTSHITTNRLHVGIASLLAGTPVALHDNSYGKVSAVFRHSIEGRYPNVEFLDSPERDFLKRRF